MRPIHNRQPALLSPNEYEEWLASTEQPQVHLLRGFLEEQPVIAQIDPVPRTLFD